MSKVGKAKIKLPEGVSITEKDGQLLIEGPKGKLSVSIFDGFKVEIVDQELSIAPSRINKKTGAFWGTLRSLINNAVIGVSKGYEKKLAIEGIGFKASVSGSDLMLNLGFSHPIIFPIPADLVIGVEKNVISISGFSKELVSQTAATIKLFKKPEPYKGKGIYYLDSQGNKEKVRRKVGKKQ